MTTPCNHHDSTGRFNYFCHVKTLQDGVHGEYVKCTKCYKKWLPDEQTTQPPKWDYEAPKDNVAIDSTLLPIKNPKACNYSSDEKEWRAELLNLIEHIHDRLHAKPEINKLREKYLV